MALVQDEESQREAEAEAALDAALFSSLPPSLSPSLSFSLSSSLSSLSPVSESLDLPFPSPIVSCNARMVKTSPFVAKHLSLNPKSDVHDAAHLAISDTDLSVASFSSPSPFPSPQLTFLFPNWSLYLSKNSSKSCKESDGVEFKKPKCHSAKKGMEAASTLIVEGTFNSGPLFLHLPEEFIFTILGHLMAVDLCSFRSVSKRCYYLASAEDLWKPLLLKRVCPDTRPSSGISSRLLYKRTILANEVGSRFFVLRKGYQFVRDSLDTWWDAGGNVPEEGIHSSATVKKVVMKLTACNWSLLYEALAVAFSDRSDRIAEELNLDVAGVDVCTSDVTLGTEGEVRSRSVMDKKDKKVYLETEVMRLERNVGSTDVSGERGSVRLSTGNVNMRGTGSSIVEPISTCIPDNKRSEVVEENEREWAFKERDKMGRLGLGFSEQETLIGLKLWPEVLKKWGIYKRWLNLLANHCSRLYSEVMLERARAAAVSTTPTLCDKGLISFRSQVLLGFGLRRFLQAGVASLAFSEVKGSSSERDLLLLQSIRRLYQQLDLMDDTTGPPRSFSQRKFRRCFRMLVTPGHLPSGPSTKDFLPSILFADDDEEV